MKTKFIGAIIVAAFLAALMFSCANQSAPGGGPIDTEPPEMAASSPEDGQVNVDLRARINITFSEWINLANARRAVAVYPRLPQGITVRTARNRITIIPNEPLKENTTYHIVIGTALSDLRGNAITQPINIIFSTGAELDSGRLYGRVVPLERLTALPRVGLYFEDEEWENARYFAAPDYMTHTDSAGAFTFSHLREGRYRIVAFVDQYRIGRLHMRDTCFTSLEKTITVTREAQTIRLYPALSDTVVAVDTSVVDTLEADVSIVDTLETDVSITDTLEIDTSIIDTLKLDTLELKPDTSDLDTLNQNDNICPLLSGRAACLEPNDRRKWMFRPQNQTEGFVVPDSAGTFTFVNIPASKGTLLWFIDNDGDDQITFGRLAPWRPPEQFFIVPGMIEAKARWEIVDLEVEGCE
ncbi:MAG: Ig-like domain-containing protein [Chitinispirillales bacterium]|jgi:hypothetical protein|nr:Ig-like domain-containing protein [Chitinispirillales bacterium]